MAASNPELRESLREVLESVHLQGYLEDACTWCEENGAWGIEELIAEDVFPDFTSDIGLKRLQVKRLLQAFEAVVGKTSQPSPAAASSSFTPHPRGYIAGSPGLPGHGVVVKNTFLDDIRPTPAELVGNRANTVPMNFQRDDDEDVEEDDDDEEVEPEGEAAAEASTGQIGADSPLIASVPSTSLLKCKLTTFDAYESSDYWDWAARNPDALPGDPAKSEPTAASSSDQPANEIAEAETSDGAAAEMANMVFVPTPMWGVPPMMFPMMPMPMDASQAQAAQAAQMQMAMGGMMMYPPMDSVPGNVSDPKPRSQVMERAFSMASQRERIRWTVDSRKLRSSDREAVSPNFEVSCGGTIAFKMVLKPKASDSNKGGACFKKSRNKGYVELRCVTDLEAAGNHIKPSLTFRLQVSSAKRTEPFRGPVRHNFADRAICGLPEGQDEWDFGKVVDHSNNTFGVVLEVLKDDS